MHTHTIPGLPSCQFCQSLTVDIPTVNEGQAALPPCRRHSTTHVQCWAHLSATVTTLTCTLVGGAVSLHRTTHYRPRTTTTEWACMHCTVSPPDTTVTGPLTSEGRSGVVLHQLERKVLLKRRQLLWQHRSPVHLRTSLSPSVALLLASSVACGAWEVTQNESSWFMCTTHV